MLLITNSRTSQYSMISGKLQYAHTYVYTCLTKYMSLAPSFPTFSPIVNTKECFDDLLVAKDHVSRGPSDTYYINDTHLLRTHTSAHQSKYITEGIKSFLCSGDVYRRDEIDASHYPVFHQMEGKSVISYPHTIYA